MTVVLDAAARGSVPIHAVSRAGCAKALAALEPGARRWLQTLEFAGAPGSFALVPGADQRLAAVWVGVRAADDPWALAACAKGLPAGHYHLADGPPALAPPEADFGAG